ncbi:MAG: hypothetical protein GY723_08615, partial [bacterium]|nr:hypothetical protein [bacterium]
MTRPSPSVTCTNEHSARLPDWATPGVTMVLDLERRGQLDPLTERARIRREGGYAGFDVVLFFVFFFAGGVSKGVRTYWEDDARSFGVQLAAIGGRKRLASPASLSRALSAVEFEDTRTLGPWLLREVAGIEAVMQHPAAMTWDAVGLPWHVFDFDPTVHTLRQRALPAGDDLPRAIRRCVELAPGYSGRKRGDTQLHRSTLQHAGSSAWLDLQAAPGNGDARAELGHALDVVAETVDALGAPRERALVRADGAFGHVPGITAARERGLPFLSRLTRPNLLDQPEVRQRLAEGTWLYVPDSRSGPRRSAIDIGLVTLTPSKATVRDDGSPYEPVEVRVVVSRYPCDEASTRGRGRVIDGWRYELYVADGLPADAWPAHEVVAQYYGRTGEENRFHQEDRELDLDRIFSYHLPGQELVTLVGLFVWNLRVALGFELAPPPEPARPLTPREAESDVRAVIEELVEDEVASADPPGEPEPIEQPPEPPIDTPPTTGIHPLEHALSVALDTFDWEQMLTRRPGWSRLPGSMTVLCPQDQLLSLTCVNNPKRRPGRSQLFFRSTFGPCCDCVSMADCFPSARPTTAKLTAFTVSLEEGAMVRAVLGPVQQLRESSPRTPKEVSPGGPQLQCDPVPPRVSLAVQQLAPEPVPGSHAIVDPLLLPAAARRTFYQATRHIDVIVTVELPEVPLPHPKLLARSNADRQHRRCTW